MRLTDLLGAEVVDRCGQPAGRVHDVRLVQDGPLIGGFGPACAGRTDRRPDAMGARLATNEATLQPAAGEAASRLAGPRWPTSRA